MRHFDDDGYEPKSYAKKKPKHAKNRPGTGMRTINRFDEDEDYFLELSDEVDLDDKSMYTKENYLNN